MNTNQYWNTCNNIEYIQSIFKDCLEWDMTLLSRSKNKMSIIDRFVLDNCSLL